MIRSSLNDLRDSVIKDVVEILEDLNLYKEKSHNKTAHSYTFDNGSSIKFLSADEPKKLKGKKHTYAYLNEASDLSYEVFLQVKLRTEKALFLDFNPDESDHWTFDLIKDEKSCLIKSTYKDNDFLSEENKREIEDLIDRDENAYKVYCLGEYAIKKEKILTNYKIVSDIPDYVKEKNNVTYGIDFGHTDPYAVVRCWKYESDIYLEELIYESYLSVSECIAKTKDIITDRSIPMYCDSSRPDIIKDFVKAGLPAKGANKDIKEGIDFLRINTLHVTAGSKNLIKELKNYSYKVVNGNITDKPVDFNNHACFVGSTLITTDKGLVPIIDIKPGDLVLTSKGYKKVLNKFNNGKKQISNFSLLFDTNSLSLSCTNNHLVKTKEEWKEISQLQSGMTVYLHKPSMVSNIHCTQKSDIFHEAHKECIEECGNISMVKYQKGTTYITSMKTLGITQLKTLNSLSQTSTYQSTGSKELKITQSGLRNFKHQELKLQKNGIQLMKENNGIESTQSKTDSVILNTGKKNVNNALLNTKQVKVNKDSVQINVSQPGEENLEQIILKKAANAADNYLQQINILNQKLVALNVLGQSEEEVYDLEVEDAHEYFANGLLVHNCDALRYGCVAFKNKQPGQQTKFARLKY
jgi:PBSX family phage terminase large subunit